MAEIRVKENESIDSALRRFKRATAKSEAARKRKYK